MTTENTVILLGNVGRNPEFQSLQNGGLVCRFSVATSTGGFVTKEGKEVPKITQWHSIVCWDRNAEYVKRFISKGALVYVRGMLKYDTYTNDKGQQVTAAYIDVSMLTLCERRQQGQPLPGDVSIDELKRRHPEMPLDDNGQPYRWEDGRVRTIPFKPGERDIKYYG